MLISLAIENRNKQGIKEIPVVIFTTDIDAINIKHKIFSLTVLFPIKNNNNKLEANPTSFYLPEI